MDLLNVLTLYMAMLYTVSMQATPPDLAIPTPFIEPSKTEIIVQQTVTIRPTSTPFYTPGPTAIAKPDITPNSDYKQIKLKDKGEDVKKLQAELYKYGYYTGEIDGAYGQQTLEAVRTFQKLHSLSADGIAGKQTLTILYESDNIISILQEQTAVSTHPPTIDTNTLDPVPVVIFEQNTPVPTFAPLTTDESSSSNTNAEIDYPLILKKDDYTVSLDVADGFVLLTSHGEYKNKQPLLTIDGSTEKYAIPVKTLFDYLNLKYDFNNDIGSNDIIWKSDNSWTIIFKPEINNSAIKALYKSGNIELNFYILFVNNTYYISTDNITNLFGINYIIDTVEKNITLI